MIALPPGLRAWLPMPIQWLDGEDDYGANLLAKPAARSVQPEWSVAGLDETDRLDSAIGAGKFASLLASLR